MRSLVIVIAPSLVLWASAIASADDRADADGHARRGVALYNLGKYADAVAEFEAAYTLFQSDMLLFNLAQSHRQLDHCELALSYYRRFMKGAPPAELAAQVDALLPKLEAACVTKVEPPGGVDATPASPVHPTTEPEPGPAATTALDVAASPSLSITASATAGTVIAGRTAPTAGVKIAATTPPPWLRGGELGLALGAARLWREDSMHDATIVNVAATIVYHSDFAWGRFTLGGELGATYFSSLDGSSGVVPGITRAGQWAPLARGEVGAEHDVAHALSIRVALAAGACPRSGELLTSVGTVDLVLGLRYAR